jgi:PDZ domain-containing secreted protein
MKTMKLKTLATLVVAAAATSAFAESPTIVKDDFVSTRTRAEVQAELFAYKKAGVNPWSISYNQLAGFKSATSRDQVVADYLSARDEVAAVNGEDSGSAYFAQAYPNGRTPGATLAGTPFNAQ